MRHHDYEGLNDTQCVHVDYFLARLERHRCQNLGEGICRVLAGGAAATKYQLTADEQRGVDAYLARLLGEVKSEGRRAPPSDEAFGIITAR